MSRKSISQNLRYILRNRTFVREKVATRRKFTMCRAGVSKVVVKLGWVNKTKRILKFSEIVLDYYCLEKILWSSHNALLSNEILCTGCQVGL